MNIASQLYKLQDIDLAIEASEQDVSRITRQLGESQTVVKAKAKLASEQQRLEESKNQQRTTEWEIDDLSNKIGAAEEKLYGGRIGNPKELASLQREVEIFKAKREQLEDKALIIMEQVELATASVASRDNELKTLEAEWQSQQKQLATEMEQVKARLSQLNHERQQFSANINPEVLETYTIIKKQKGTAVAKVEQGVCRGCRISLSTAELQNARTGSLVQCTSCGRILFLA